MDMIAHDQSPSDVASDGLARDKRKWTPVGDGAVTQAGAASGDSPMSNKAEVDVCPDGGYGWVVVLSMSGIYSVSFGIATVYGVYIAYFLEKNYYPGGSTFGYAWIGGLSEAVCLLCAPLSNWMVRKWGVRFPTILGGLCLVLGQVGGGLSKSFAGFVMCMGVVYGLGLGLTLIPTAPLVAHWFDKRIAFAQGLTEAGPGLGALYLAPVTRVLLTKYTPKWALIASGLISLIILVPSIAFLRGRHVQIADTSTPFHWQYILHRGFSPVLLWGALSVMAYLIAIYSLDQYATQALGLSQAKGAALQSIMAASSVIGRPGIGYLLDSAGRINMTVLAQTISAVSCLAIWLPSSSFGVLVLFAIVQGAVGGTVWSASTSVVSSIVPREDVASALGIYWLALAVPALVAQPIAVLLVQYSQDHLVELGRRQYASAIGFCGGLNLAAALALLWAKRWKQGDWAVFRRT